MTHPLFFTRNLTKQVVERSLSIKVASGETLSTIPTTSKKTKIIKIKQTYVALGKNRRSPVNYID